MHYSGGCHCGRIAFEFDSDAPVAEVIECNCSLCAKRGHLSMRMLEKIVVTF